MREITFKEINSYGETLISEIKINVHTEKGIAQIAKWQSQYNEAKATEAVAQKNMKGATDDMYKYYRRLRNQANDKAWKILDKVQEFGKIGLTAIEINKLYDDGGVVINLDKDIIGQRVVKVTFFKYLKVYVKYSYHKYSGYMANVRGCGSLAGKKELDSFEIITQEEYNNYANGPKQQTINFMGHAETKIVPAKYNDMVAGI